MITGKKNIPANQPPEETNLIGVGAYVDEDNWLRKKKPGIKTKIMTNLQRSMNALFPPRTHHKKSRP